AAPDREDPVVGIACVDGRGFGEVDVPHLVGTVGPELEGGLVEADARGECAGFEVGVEAGLLEAGRLVGNGHAIGRAVFDGTVVATVVVDGVPLAYVARRIFGGVRCDIAILGSVVERIEGGVFLVRSALFDDGIRSRIEGGHIDGGVLRASLPSGIGGG